jgi:putative photosynthetic complex assembly protein 2
MLEIALPVLAALFAWWFATGAILLLDGLPRRTYRVSLAAASVVALAALVGLALTRADLTPSGAFIAFACGLGVWAWQEMAFLMGLVTGPRRTVCEPGCRGARHFMHGVHAILHHELALLAGGAAVLAATWGGANWVGPATYGVLWVMRQSAKLNLFLGVRNLGESMLPDHLQYLKAYFRRRAMNPLLPLSVMGAALGAALLVRSGLEAAATANAFGVTGCLLVATLLALAAVEHLFLVLPVPLDGLWRFALRTRRTMPPVVAVPVEVKR